MRLLDHLMYDPRKFFGAVVFLFWVLPIVIVLTWAFSANAMTSTRDSASGSNYSTGMSSHQNNPNSTNDYCPINPHGSHSSSCDSSNSNSTTSPVTRSNDNSCECHEGNNTRTSKAVYQTQPALSHQTNDCGCHTSTPSQTTQTQAPKVIYKSVPQTKVVERTRIVPQKTTVIRYVPQPSAQSSNNSANAAAAASAVVNLASQPQVAAVSTTYPTNTTSASTTTTANNAPASTNAVYQSPTTSSVSYGKTLPNTGAGDVVALAGFATVFATLAHYFYRRRLA